MPIGGERRHAAARRALQVALLDEVGLEHILDRLGILADGVREIVEPHRAARELLDHREEQLAVHDVEPERAAGPSPIMMSIWKSSSAGYRISSTTGDRR